MERIDFILWLTFLSTYAMVRIANLLKLRDEINTHNDLNKLNIYT